MAKMLTIGTNRLHRYVSDVAHVDIYWYIGNRLNQAPAQLPRLSEPISGSSIVPWRYHFNTGNVVPCFPLVPFFLILRKQKKNPMLTLIVTVTFSYTTAFWSWEEWGLQLEWMALHGINLLLAWVGFEHTLVEVFRDIGLTDSENSSFLSGPAFQAWNRFGSIQGDWGPDGPETLPEAWIEGQFELQKKIVARMVDLGMTPVLPAFPGFVPHAISRVFPNASVVNASQWAGFPPRYSNDSFLEPFDDHFARLQKSFISKQHAAYGNVTHLYTLDQYNELNPYSGNLTYLHVIATSTIQSLKSVDPKAIWLMQGWLFYEASDFWTNERVQAYLSGVNNIDMLILDLYSESEPQWQRTHSYYGKPWIWCMLHDYGGNMGLYGQIMNVTQNPIEALDASDSLVGIWEGEDNPGKGSCRP